MANFRKQAFAQRLRDYMLEERGTLRKQAASPIEYPQLQGTPGGGMSPEQGTGMDPAMLEQIAAATGMDPQQLAQMPPEQLDQLMQELQGGAPQEGGQEGQGGQANAMPSLNITAKGDIAVETVNNMMGTQKMASFDKKAAFANTLATFMAADRNEYMNKSARGPAWSPSDRRRRPAPKSVPHPFAEPEPMTALPDDLAARVMELAHKPKLRSLISAIGRRPSKNQPPYQYNDGAALTPQEASRIAKPRVSPPQHMTKRQQGQVMQEAARNAQKDRTFLGGVGNALFGKYPQE